jgi:hypothetical protein
MREPVISAVGELAAICDFLTRHYADGQPKIALVVDLVLLGARGHRLDGVEDVRRIGELCEPGLGLRPVTQIHGNVACRALEVERTPRQRNNAPIRMPSRASQ